MLHENAHNVLALTADALDQLYRTTHPLILVRKSCKNNVWGLVTIDGELGSSATSVLPYRTYKSDKLHYLLGNAQLQQIKVNRIQSELHFLLKKVELKKY